MADIFTGVASQAGHWYSPDGSPAYEITGANGKVRPVTLRDARKLNLYPSVTTILNVAAKPQLEQWKVRQGILSALTLPRLDGETDDDYAVRALKDSKEQSIKAAQRGTLMHEMIERHFLGRVIDAEFRPFVEPVIGWLNESFPGANWSAERSFSHKMGFGGKVDLFSENPAVVIDFKTKDFDDPEKVKGYDEQGIQLAAYQTGLGLQRIGDVYPMRWNLFVSTRVPGLIVPVEWDADTFDRHWTMFCCLLDYWHADKGYKPMAMAA